MNFLTFLKKLEVFFLKVFLRKWLEKPQPKISLIIPFSSGDRTRKKLLKWLLEYWKHELPEAEIVIGKSKGKIFCKGEALNDAVQRSTGEVLVIIDSDAYLPGTVIEYCADRILENPCDRLWFVPYRHLYRLTKRITKQILKSNPANPYRPPCHPPKEFIENNGHKSKYGHRYGAMIMIFPREAYDLLGCFDERFRGWGGEDVSLLRALDTLYGKHKTTRNCIFHLWHPFIGEDYKNRKWKGQEHGNVNGDLAYRYHRATRKPEVMRKLVNEGVEFTKNKHQNNGLRGKSIQRGNSDKS